MFPTRGTAVADRTSYEKHISCYQGFILKNNSCTLLFSTSGSCAPSFNCNWLHFESLIHIRINGSCRQKQIIQYRCTCMWTPLHVVPQFMAAAAFHNLHGMCVVRERAGCAHIKQGVDVFFFFVLPHLPMHAYICSLTYLMHTHYSSHTHTYMHTHNQLPSFPACPSNLGHFEKQAVRTMKLPC